MSNNPYRPNLPAGYGRPPARKRNSLPASAIVTRIVASLLLLIVLGNIVFHGFSFWEAFNVTEEQLTAKARQQNVAVDPKVLYAVMGLMGLFVLCFCSLHAFFSIRMIMLRGWGYALAASIMAIVPCACPTSFFSIPLGIAGIVLLCQKPVKQAFRE